MSVTPRKLKNGQTHYDVRVTMGRTADGKEDKRFQSCRTMREAKAAEAAMVAEREVLRGKSNRITLEQYIEFYYWPSALSRLAATSLDSYDAEIRLRIIPHLGSVDVRDIDRARIQSMLSTIPTRTVARKCLGTLKTILNEAKGDGIIATNPATANYALPIESRRRDNGVVLQSFDQIFDMLDIVSARGSQCVQRIAYTGLLLGLRPEERYALTWQCFDLQARTVTITQARVIASAKHGGVQNKETKTKNSRRVIPMHPAFHEWLVDVPRVSDRAAFITGATGKMISPATAQHRWARFLAANSDCPPVTIENMRHSFATAYIAAGGRIETLSRILGHANISTTVNRYFKPDVTLLAEELNRISDNFSTRKKASEMVICARRSSSILRASTTD